MSTSALPRTLGLAASVAVVVGVSIGSGIFRVPAVVAAQLHEPLAIIACWILGGLVALAGALSVAELAAALPEAGGIFAWLHAAYGPFAAFLFGWSELAVLRASALGATATIFAEYASWFLHLGPVGVHRLAALAIVGIGLLNIAGLQHAARVMNLATGIKYVLIVGLAVLAAWAAWRGGALPAAVPGTDPETPMRAGFAAGALVTALVPVMWTYDGWADLSFIAGEVREPQRTLPRALIIGTGAVTAAYLLLNAALLALFTPQQMAGAPLIAARAAERVPLLGTHGASVVAALVMIATFSGLNGSMMTGSRIFYAMAGRGLFFRGIARVSARFQTPVAAIVLATALGVAYVLGQDFAQLADRFVLGLWPFYALSVAAVFVLRRRRPDLPRAYRAIGYPVVPLLFLAASLLLVGNALYSDPRGTLTTLGITALGAPLYVLWRRFAPAGAVSEGG